MIKSDEFELERGAAAKTEGEDRKSREENRHHNRDGTVGSRKSPAALSPVDILSKDNMDDAADYPPIVVSFGSGQVCRQVRGPFGLSLFVSPFFSGMPKRFGIGL